MRRDGSHGTDDDLPRVATCQVSCEHSRSAASTYVVRGSHGEHMAFGVSVVLEPSDIPKDACESFRAKLLWVFGRPDPNQPGSGRRAFPTDGYGWEGELGRKPGSRLPAGGF
jgi:hypothetical protein